VAADEEDCRKAVVTDFGCWGCRLIDVPDQPWKETNMLPNKWVKVLLKLVQAVENGDDITDYWLRLSLLIPSLKAMLHSKHKKSVCKARSETDMMDLELLSAAFCHRAARLLVEVAAQLKSFVMGGMNAQEAWNQALVQMARISRAYSQFLLLQNFMHGIEEEA
jgi:acyl-CoA oxidase